MQPDFKIVTSNKPVKWAIKIKELSGYDGVVGVGICFRNRFFNSGMTLESAELRSLGNGIYLAMSQGFTLSHSVEGQNFDRNTPHFKENDIINVCYDPEKRTFKVVKNNEHKIITLDDLENPPEGDFYVPCVSIGGKHTVAEIVDANEDIDWDDDGKKKKEGEEESEKGSQNLNNPEKMMINNMRKDSYDSF